MARLSVRRRAPATLALIAIGALALAATTATAQNPEALLVNAIVTSFAAVPEAGAAAASAMAPADAAANETMIAVGDGAAAAPMNATTEAGFRDMDTNMTAVTEAAPMAEAASGKMGKAGGSSTAATLRAMIGSAAAAVPKPFGGIAQRAVEAQTRGFVSGVAAKVAAGPQATDAKHPLSDAMRQNPLLALLAPAADASYATKQAFLRAVETGALDKLRAFVAGSEVVGEYSRDELANYVATFKALSAATKTALSGKASALDLSAADLKKSVVSLRDVAGAAKDAGSEELQRKAADAVVAADALGEAASSLAGDAADTAAAAFASVAAQGAAAADVYRAAEASAAAMLKATVAKKADLISGALDRATTALRLLKMGTGPLMDKGLDAQAAGIATLRAGLKRAVAAIEGAPVPSDLIVAARRSAAARDKPLLDKALQPAKKAAGAVGKFVGAQDGAEIEAAGADAAQSVDAALNGALVGLAGRFREFEGAFEDVKAKFGGEAAPGV